MPSLTFCVWMLQVSGSSSQLIGLIALTAAPLAILELCVMDAAGPQNSVERQVLYQRRYAAVA